MGRVGTCTDEEKWDNFNDVIIKFIPVNNIQTLSRDSLRGPSYAAESIVKPGYLDALRAKISLPAQVARGLR
jgi:hypothetical protein